MKVTRRHVLRAAGGTAALPLLPRFAAAQAYPTRPVRIVVPYPAGIAPDIATRLVAQALSERLGQQPCRSGSASSLSSTIGRAAPPISAPSS
jgi:tripartite-type tricarboxylate transporter receptor subunit TctC